MLNSDSVDHSPTGSSICISVFFFFLKRRNATELKHSVQESLLRDTTCIYISQPEADFGRQLIPIYPARGAEDPPGHGHVARPSRERREISYLYIHVFTPKLTRGAEESSEEISYN